LVDLHWARGRCHCVRQRYRSDWPRRYYLLTADLWFNGRVTNAVSVECFVFQAVQRSGQRGTLCPHLGFETEAWPKRMKIRGIGGWN